MSDPAARLRAELGDLAVLDTMTNDQCERLLRLYEQACLARESEMAEAQDSALRTVPRPLRPTLRRILFR
ncbi:hypothetical protein [Haloechinothrix halophila]|uniref:hypothetical protein n=1 Tax=Haloechinothrix halophila TaxID=1069073 RepID=UPI00040ACF3D|nr:hypothetical protein [Haloechinothrix halophila]